MVERPAIPAMRSVRGCASALRRCSAGPRRPPASARPVTAVWPASAGCSHLLPLPTISSGCPSWWEPRRSHARNLPRHGKNQRNRRKDLLDKRSSATQTRVPFDDSKYCFANTEFFRVLLIGHNVSELVENVPDLLHRLKLAAHSPTSKTD